MPVHLFNGAAGAIQYLPRDPGEYKGCRESAGIIAVGRLAARLSSRTVIAEDKCFSSGRYLEGRSRRRPLAARPARALMRTTTRTAGLHPPTFSFPGTKGQLTRRTHPIHQPRF